jgi:hypothetical protein
VNKAVYKARLKRRGKNTVNGIDVFDLLSQLDALMFAFRGERRILHVVVLHAEIVDALGMSYEAKAIWWHLSIVPNRRFLHRIWQWKLSGPGQVKKQNNKKPK